jgi:hypothetical protein
MRFTTAPRHLALRRFSRGRRSAHRAARGYPTAIRVKSSLEFMPTAIFRRKNSSVVLLRWLSAGRHSTLRLGCCRKASIRPLVKRQVSRRPNAYGLKHETDALRFGAGGRFRRDRFCRHLPTLLSVSVRCKRRRSLVRRSPNARYAPARNDGAFKSSKSGCLRSSIAAASIATSSIST